MARQRVREHLTWSAAVAAHKKVERALAQKACTGSAVNTAEEWRMVGAYRALGELLWECDK